MFSLALPVGSVCPAFKNTFIESDPTPAKGLNNVLLRTGYIARLIRIFNAKDELPAMFAGEQIIIQSGSDTSDMQGTCGTRGKPYNNLV
jgi:hypothetical protein